MRKLGIFMGFQPGDQLTIHGIGRLLAFLLKESETDVKSITLICPAWLKESLYELMKDHKIPEKKFEVLTTKNVPVGVRIREKLKKRLKKKPKASLLTQILQKTVYKFYLLSKNITTNLLSTSSIGMFLMKAMGLLMFCILMSPLIVLAALLIIVGSSLMKLRRKISRMINNFHPKSSFESKGISTIRRLGGRIYAQILENELSRMVKIVNDNKDIDVCYIPSMTWPQIQGLKCKKVLAAPDIVFYDFPTQFAGVTDLHKRIRKSISAADHIICYSEHVKNKHLVEKCGVDRQKITVIKHANINMDEHLKVPKSIEKYLSVKHNAKQIIESYIRVKYNPGHVLYNCNIDNVDFVVYSSQNRPHKNILNLIKAMKIINKEYHRNLKLILTGDILIVDEIRHYIFSNFLDDDIIVMHNITSEMLAALNAMARCAVNPTLFEGGFPFTFSEAYSVGTPSVMSNIPVVSSEIEDKVLREQMLFDPYNPYSIAKKIIWACEHTQDLYNAQDNLYQKFNTRSWKSVVDEYNQVFSSFK